MPSSPSIEYRYINIFSPFIKRSILLRFNHTHTHNLKLPLHLSIIFLLNYSFFFLSSSTSSSSSFQLLSSYHTEKKHCIGKRNIILLSSSVKKKRWKNCIFVWSCNKHKNTIAISTRTYFFLNIIIIISLCEMFFRFLPVQSITQPSCC